MDGRDDPDRARRHRDAGHLDEPNSARMYDYYLGGSANFAVDRAAAEAGSAALPHARDYAVANRSFLGRAVRHLVRSGIRQFLDLGSGIPTVGNVHEIAQRYDRDVRVVYVDHDPIAVAHSRALLNGQPHVSITQNDIRGPNEVLSAPETDRLLDFSRPVAVLAVAILPFVPDLAEATGLIATYRDACVPGSYLALSHISPIWATARQVAAAEEVMARTPTPVRWRGREDIAAFLDGYTLVPPGLVPTPLWNPEITPTQEEIERSHAYAAVGMR